MNSTRLFDRRRFLGAASAATAAATVSPLLAGPAGAPWPGSQESVADLPTAFPQQDPAIVKEVVGAAHGNFDRVRELVDGRPTLALATWDWGFGDWESALGAAAHTGNRDIARYLIAHGARPSLYSAAMLGQLDVVRAFCEAQPGVQSIPGPHGISLLAHARAGGEAAAHVLAYLDALGGADERPQTAPLTDEERRALHGVYVFGSGETERFTALDSSRGTLQIRRGDDTPRGLAHLGDLQFYPAGAPAVRIVFARTGGGVTGLRVIDGAIDLAAARVG